MPAPMPFEAPVTTATLPLRLLITLSWFDSYTSVEVWWEWPGFKGGRRIFASEVERREAQRWRRQSDFRQPVQIGLQHIAFEDQIHELAVAAGFDQARRFQLFDVMGQGGGSDFLG